MLSRSKPGQKQHTTVRMPALKEPKSQEKRISECLAILKRLTEEVGIPATNPTIRTLKKRMSVYWRDGKLQEDSLPLFGYNRSVMYKLPKWEHQEVEVTLRINNFTVRKHPEDLQAEIDIYKLEKSISDVELYATKRLEEIGSNQLATVDTLRCQQPLSDPSATFEEQTNNASQSDPSHPSLPA